MKAAFLFLRDFGLLDQYTTATEVKALHSLIIMKNNDLEADVVCMRKPQSRANAVRAKMKRALDIIMTSTAFATASDVEFETSSSPGLLSMLVGDPLDFITY